MHLWRDEETILFLNMFILVSIFAFHFYFLCRLLFWPVIYGIEMTL